MKRKREEDFYTIHPDTSILEPSLAEYIQKDIVKTARFDPEDGKYHFIKRGTSIACGGLLGAIQYRYYPKYETFTGRRNWRQVNVKGSSSAQGKATDRHVTMYTKMGGERKHLRRVSVMTTNLLDYFENIGHIPQAAQLPVEIPGWNKMTQADYITKDPATGELFLWEIKTGFPVGGFRTQKDQPNFKSTHHIIAGTKCTKYNVWQLQLKHTLMALQSAGIRIKKSAVIQVYEDKTKGCIVKVHEPPEWVDYVTPFLSVESVYKPQVFKH